MYMAKKFEGGTVYIPDTDEDIKEPFPERDTYCDTDFTLHSLYQELEMEEHSDGVKYPKYYGHVHMEVLNNVPNAEQGTDVDSSLEREIAEEAPNPSDIVYENYNRLFEHKQEQLELLKRQRERVIRRAAVKKAQSEQDKKRLRLRFVQKQYEELLKQQQVDGSSESKLGFDDLQEEDDIIDHLESLDKEGGAHSEQAKLSKKQAELKNEIDELTAQVYPPIAPKVDASGRAYGTGKRKRAIARVWVRPGTGRFFINGLPNVEYFTRAWYLATISAPLKVIGNVANMDVRCTVKGGGLTGNCVFFSFTYAFGFNCKVGKVLFCFEVF